MGQAHLLVSSGMSLRSAGRVAPSAASLSTFDAHALESSAQHRQCWSIRKPQQCTGLRRRDSDLSTDMGSPAAKAFSPCGKVTSTVSEASTTDASPRSSLKLAPLASASLFCSLGLERGSMQLIATEKRSSRRTAGARGAEMVTSVKVRSQTGVDIKDKVAAPGARAKLPAGSENLGPPGSMTVHTPTLPPSSLFSSLGLESGSQRPAAAKKTKARGLAPRPSPQPLGTRLEGSQDEGAKTADVPGRTLKVDTGLLVQHIRDLLHQHAGPDASLVQSRPSASEGMIPMKVAVDSSSVSTAAATSEWLPEVGVYTYGRLASLGGESIGSSEELALGTAVFSTAIQHVRL